MTRKILNLLLSALFVLGISACSDESGGGNPYSSNLKVNIKLDNTNGQTVNFSAMVEGTVPEKVMYRWHFGDGKSEETAIPRVEYTYQAKGTYNAYVEMLENGSVIAASQKAVVDATNDPVMGQLRIRTEQQGEDKRSYLFTIPSQGEVKNTYEWYFEDNKMDQEAKTNVEAHTFSQYGKTYEVRVVARSKEDSIYLGEERTNVYTDVPDFGLNVSSVGLDAYASLTSTISVPDAKVTWLFCEDSKCEEIKDRPFNDEVRYVFKKGGKKSVKAIISAPQLAVNISKEKEFYINADIILGALTAEAESGELKYNFSIFAKTNNNDLSKSLKYRFEFGDGNKTEWQNTNTAAHTYDMYKYDSPRVVKYCVKVDGTEDAEEVCSTKNITVTKPKVELRIIDTDDPFTKQLCASLDKQWLGNIIYNFDFGDGESHNGSENPCVTHKYKDGNYQAYVTAKSDKSTTSTDKAVKSVAVSSLISSIDITAIEDQNDPLKYSFKSSVTGSFQNEDVIYLWNVGGQEYSAKEIKSHHFPIYGKAYSVSLKVSIRNTDISVSKDMQITTKQPTTVDLTPKNHTVDAGQAVMFTATYGKIAGKHDASLTNVKYTYTVDNIQRPAQDNKMYAHTFDMSGKHTVQVKVTADNMQNPIISAVEYVNVNNINLKPGDVKSLTLTCTPDGGEWNLVKQNCVATVQMADGTTNGAVNKVEVWVRDKDRRFYNKSSKSGANHVVEFDWPENMKAGDNKVRTYEMVAEAWIFPEDGSKVEAVKPVSIKVETKNYIDYTLFANPWLQETNEISYKPYILGGSGRYLSPCDFGYKANANGNKTPNFNGGKCPSTSVNLGLLESKKADLENSMEIEWIYDYNGNQGTLKDVYKRNNIPDPSVISASALDLWTEGNNHILNKTMKIEDITHNRKFGLKIKKGKHISKDMIVWYDGSGKGGNAVKHIAPRLMSMGIPNIHGYENACEAKWKKNPNDWNKSEIEFKTTLVMPKQDAEVFNNNGARFKAYGSALYQVFGSFKTAYGGACGTETWAGDSFLKALSPSTFAFKADKGYAAIGYNFFAKAKDYGFPVTHNACYVKDLGVYSATISIYVDNKKAEHLYSTVQCRAVR